MIPQKKDINSRSHRSLPNDRRPSEYTIPRVTRESGGSSAGHRRKIYAGVPYELTPYSVTATSRLHRTRVHTAFTGLTIPHTRAAHSLPHSKHNTPHNYAANSSSSSQEIRRILWNPTVRYNRPQQYYSTPRTNVTGLPPQSSPIIYTIYCKIVRHLKTKATQTCRSSSNQLGNERNNSAI